jgi:hypothetical protein
MLYSFFATVHARPQGARAGATIELSGRGVRTLDVERDVLSSTPLAITFEAARQRLDQLPRMYTEADGSFVWASSQGESRWQVDGNLYDTGQRLLFVDLKGSCPPEAFDRLLTSLGWPETPLMFQLTRQAVFLDEAEFRRWAQQGGRSSTE